MPHVRRMCHKAMSPVVRERKSCNACAASSKNSSVCFTNQPPLSPCRISLLSILISRVKQEIVRYDSFRGTHKSFGDSVFSGRKWPLLRGGRSEGRNSPHVRQGNVRPPRAAPIAPWETSCGLQKRSMDYLLSPCAAS